MGPRHGSSLRKDHGLSLIELVFNPAELAHEDEDTFWPLAFVVWDNFSQFVGGVH